MFRIRPIFFFAFANDRAYRLRLEKEERAVREALRTMDSQGQLEYKSIGQTNLQDIYNTFNSFHNRIYIFHYGGHSDSEFLHLSGHHANSKQLAMLLGQQKYLKLVFLNGCANHTQVEALFEEGVAAVVATRTKIDDELSCILAEQFYQALAAGKTIRQAFDSAASFSQQIKPGLEIRYRSLSTRSSDPDEFSWGLYAADVEALDWHIGLVDQESYLETLGYLRDASQRRFQAFSGKGGRFRYLRIDEVLLAGIGSHSAFETRKLIETAIGDKKTPLENSLNSIWDAECPHALLVGAGGMGKTVSLVQLWQHFLDQTDSEGPVPIFVPLHEFNSRPEKGFIRNYIVEYYAEIDIERLLKEPLNPDNENYQPHLILLLDGFNEVTAESNELILELNDLKAMDKYPGIQLVLTSRVDIRLGYQWQQFHLLELQPLSDQQIARYLNQPLPNDLRLLDLLRNPMMLSIYSAQTELPLHFKELGLLKELVSSTGEMLYNVEMLQRIKIETQYFGNLPEQAFRRFILEHVLANIAWQMLNAGLFSLEKRIQQKSFLGIEEALNKALTECLHNDFFGAFPFFSEYLDEKDFEKNDRKLFHKIINQVCCRELTVLVEEQKSYRFLHQNFRDYFAARYVQHKIFMALQKGQLPEILKLAPLNFNVRQLLGELEGEHNSKPKYLEEEKRWSNDHVNGDNLLPRVLELCRDSFDQNKLGYTVWNIITIWKEQRGELSGVDLDRLDLQTIDFNDLRTSRPGLVACFSWSILSTYGLLPQGHAGIISSVAYSPDGQHILTGSNDQTAKVWDAKTGQCLLTLYGHSGSVNCAVFSREGQQILTGSNDYDVKIWDVKSGRCLLTLEGHRDRIRSVAYSPDEKRILSGSLDSTAKVWDAQSGQDLLTLKGHSMVVESVAFSPNGKYILTGAWDKMIKVWDAGTGDCLLTIEGHTGRVRSTVFSPDGKRIISGSDDNTAKVWEAGSGECLLTLEGHKSWIESAVSSSDGQRILTSSDDNTAKIWDAVTGKCLLTLKGHLDSVTSAIFSLDEKRVLTGSDDMTAKVWEVETGHCIFTLFGYSDKVNSIDLNSDGQLLLTGSNDKTAKVWDVTSGKCILTLQGHLETVNCVSLSPDGGFILTGSNDQTAKLWELTSGRCILTFEGHNGKVSNGVFHPGGQRILTGSYDNTAKVWDTRSGKCLLTIEGHSGKPKTAIFSLDGHQILTVSDDNTAKVWDAQAGKCLFILEGHSESIRSLNYSPDGKGIFTVSEDNMTKLWDAQNGKCLLTLEDFSDESVNKLYSSDKSHFFTISDGSKVTMVENESGNPLHVFHNIPGLLIQGCDFRHLHPDSRLSDEAIGILRQYGGIFNDEDAQAWSDLMKKYSGFGDGVAL